MSASGQRFLELLSAFPPGSFEYRFSGVATRLRLSAVMDYKDLDFLFEAALFARLCNVSFNGLGGYKGELKPERERFRRTVEHEFMARKARLLDCPGWKSLPISQREAAEKIFFNVLVAEANLVQDQ